MWCHFCAVAQVSGKPKGTAFVEFEYPADAQKAAAACARGRAKTGPGVTVAGRQIDIDMALTQVCTNVGTWRVRRCAQMLGGFGLGVGSEESKGAYVYYRVRALLDGNRVPVMYVMRQNMEGLRNA